MIEKEKIIIAGDHKSHGLKKELVSFLSELGFEPLDLGAYSEERVDYPLYSFAVADKISRGQYKRGIVICYTGIGVSIVANKFPRVRAALVHNEEMAELTRKHNDTNVLALGAHYLPTEEAKKILKKWLFTEYEGGRHQNRLEQITKIEKDLMRDVYAMHKKNIKIAASLMCANQLNIIKDVNELVNAGVDIFHLDIIDGHFAENLSMNIDHVFALRSHTNIPIEVHLMVKNPKPYIPKLAAAGANTVCIHVESEGDLHSIIDEIRSTKMKVGLSINVETPIEKVYPYLNKVHVIMFMCVKTGFKAMPFEPSVLKKIHTFKQYLKTQNLNHSIILEADGSVGPRTIPHLYKEGIEVFVGGTSGLFRQGSFAENIQLMRSYCH